MRGPWHMFCIGFHFLSHWFIYLALVSMPITSMNNKTWIVYNSVPTGTGFCLHWTASAHILLFSSGCDAGHLDEQQDWNVYISFPQATGFCVGPTKKHASTITNRRDRGRDRGQGSKVQCNKVSTFLMQPWGFYVNFLFF